MKTSTLLLTISMVLLTISGFSKSSVNTEDYRSGQVTIQDRSPIQSTKVQDKQILRAEKKSFKQEKRLTAFSDKINTRLAKKTGRLSETEKTTMSLLAMIFGVAGFLFIFIPYIGVLGILLGIGGFVLGLVSLKKEGSNVFNILGIVFGGLTVLLFLLAVAIVASWGF